MRIKKHFLPLIAVAGLIVFISVVNYLWLSLNKQPPVDDEAIHLISALKYFYILKQSSVDMFFQLFSVDVLYPPLFPFVAAVISMIVGQTNTVLFCMTNLLFLSLTFVCLYFIGLKTGGRWSGVVAACLLVLYPMYFHLSRMFMIEIALVAMVTLCITLLLYSQNFKKRSVCLFAGVCFGLGLLTKQTFPFFILGPAVLFFIKDFSGFNSKERDRVVNALLVVIIGVVVALPWYLFNFKTKFMGALEAVSDAALVPKQPAIFSYPSLLYYVFEFVKTQAMLLLALFFVFAVIFLYVSKKMRGVGLFVIWIMVPYGILSFFPNKFYYYTLPCLPAVAFLTILGFSKIRIRFFRIVGVLFLFILCVHQFIIFSFFSPSMLCVVLQGAFYTPRVCTSQAINLVDRIDQEYREKSVTIGVWHVDGNEAAQKNVVTGAAGILLNKHMLQYAFDLKGRLCEVVDLRGSSRRADGLFPEFIILPCLWVGANIGALSKDKYRLIDIFELPDLSRVYLYKFFENASAETNPNIHKNPCPVNVAPHEFDKDMKSRLMDLLLPANASKFSGIKK